MPTVEAIETWKEKCRAKTTAELRELLTSRGLHEYKRRYALLEIENRERTDIEASMAEQLALARSAADSAAKQADEARKANLKADTANTIASIAMVAAVIAIAISIIGLFVGR